MICMMYTTPLKTTIQTKKRKILIVFDDMIADMINNKKLNPVLNCLLEVENLVFLLSLLLNHILKC